MLSIIKVILPTMVKFRVYLLQEDNFNHVYKIIFILFNSIDTLWFMNFKSCFQNNETRQIHIMHVYTYFKPSKYIFRFKIVFYKWIKSSPPNPSSYT